MKGRMELYKRLKKPCPPHFPVAVLPIGASFAATCVRCGASGPTRRDYEEARLDFDEFRMKTPLMLVKN